VLVKTLKILIVDEYLLYREGLHYVLNELGENVIILEAADFKHAVQEISVNPDLDLVLLDLSIQSINGNIALDTITKQYPTIPIVILSVSDINQDIQYSLDAGAIGYILKTSSHTEILKGLRHILSGNIYISH